MWAVIGVFEGQEDNTFYRARRTRDRRSRTHRRSAPATRRCWPADVIHRIANHHATPLQAIHVYGGDLLGTERAMWDDDTGAERRFDFAAPPIQAMSN